MLFFTTVSLNGSSCAIIDELNTLNVWHARRELT